MDALSIRRGLLATLLISIIGYTTALRIGFGETDYYAYEHKEGVEITVNLMGKNYGDVPIVVKTRTYAQVDEHYWPKGQVKLPDPAEYEIGGRQDFVNETFTYVFESDQKSNKEVTILVQLNDDGIDEKQEGFFVEITVDKSQLVPEDRDIKYLRNRQIALIRIEDDEDKIRLSFSERSYTVSEDAGEQANLIAVVKEDNRTTEKTLEVLVQISSYSDAKQGEDYTTQLTHIVTFAPEEQIKFIPFEVINDLIAEKRESFTLYLSTPVTTEAFHLGTIQNTVVYIEDDEEAVVGFEYLKYTVRQRKGELTNVEVCVKVYEPAKTEFFITGFLTTENGTATDDQDYYPMTRTPVAFTQRGCQTIYIRPDHIEEDIENFKVRFELDTTNEINVVIGKELDLAQVSIVDSNCTGGKDIYFAVDTTTSNPRLSLCQTIYSIELMTAVVNPKNFLNGTRVGSVLYPTAAIGTSHIPDSHKLNEIGTQCTSLIHDYHSLINGFWHHQASNPYYKYVHGAGTYPVQTLEKITELILDEIKANNSLANRRRVVVFVTDGGDDGRNDKTLHEAASKLANISGVTIVVAGNQQEVSDPSVKANFRRVLQTISPGDPRNVVIRDNAIDMTVDLVKRMADIGALCKDDAALIIDNLKSEASKAYCACLGAASPRSTFLSKRECQINCNKLGLKPEVCRVPPTCNQAFQRLP